MAVEIDDALLLLETDAPVPIGGQPGHPARVAEVLAKLAALKGVEEGTLAARTQANVDRFLNGG